MLKYKNIDRASEMRLFAARRSPTKQKHDLNQEVGGLRGDPWNSIRVELFRIY